MVFQWKRAERVQDEARQRGKVRDGGWKRRSDVLEGLMLLLLKMLKGAVTLDQAPRERSKNEG